MFASSCCGQGGGMVPSGTQSAAWCVWQGRETAAALQVTVSAGSDPCKACQPPDLMLLDSWLPELLSLGQ